MKIQFRANCSCKELLAAFAAGIETEDIGFEGAFGSSARLSSNGTTWTTFWSGFVYRILNAGSNDPAIIEYSGASAGFLQQNLIPFHWKEEEIEILSAEGTYGSFHGPLAVRLYREVKENFEERFWLLKKEKNLPAGNGWQVTKAAAIMFLDRPEYYNGSFEGGWKPSEEYQKIAREELRKLFPEKSAAAIVAAAQLLSLTWGEPESSPQKDNDDPDSGPIVEIVERAYNE